MNLDKFHSALLNNPKDALSDYVKSFEEMCETFNIQEIIATEMVSWISNPRKTPPIVTENTLRLKRIGNYTLDLNLLKITELPKIISSHQSIIQYFFEDVNCSTFNIIYQNDIAVEIREKHLGVIKKNNAIYTDGLREIFVAHSLNPIKFISLSNFYTGGVLYKFDTVSKKQIGTYAASPSLTTMQLATRFLGYYGDENCISTLKNLLHDPVYAIKWEAACALTRISTDEGLKAMKQLTASQDREIANAAEEAIQNLVRNQYAD